MLHSTREWNPGDDISGSIDDLEFRRGPSALLLDRIIQEHFRSCPAGVSDRLLDAPELEALSIHFDPER